MLQQGMEGLRGLGQTVERIQDQVKWCYVLALCGRARASGLRKGSMPGAGEEAGVRGLHGGRGCKAGSWRVLMLSAGVKRYMGAGSRLRQGGKSRNKAGRETFG